MGCESWHLRGNGPPSRPTGPRRRASHSMEAVLTEAVALLDEAGERALTFRALAARLGGGVGSIYWYVSSKDELLDRAADHVLADVLGDVEKLPASDDPIDDLRAIARHAVRRDRRSAVARRLLPARHRRPAQRVAALRAARSAARSAST